LIEESKSKGIPLPQEVESHEKLCGCVKEFIDDIYPKHKNETVVVVSHGGTKRAFYAVINNEKTITYSKKNSRYCCIGICFQRRWKSQNYFTKLCKAFRMNRFK